MRVSPFEQKDCVYVGALEFKANKQTILNGRVAGRATYSSTKENTGGELALNVLSYLEKA